VSDVPPSIRDESSTAEPAPASNGFSRRRLLGGAAVGLGGIAVGGITATKIAGSVDARGSDRVGFYGTH
jgi:hypothetical protein